MIRDAGIYVGNVWHRRHRPVEHSFSYPLWWLWVEVDEIDELLSRSHWWGRRWRPLVVRDSDYVVGTAPELRQRLQEQAQLLGLDWQGGHICMLAQPRILGWCFNPLALYWHFPEQGSEPDSVIAEVHNTPWHQRHYYRLNVERAVSKDGYRHAKAFHVSPFMPMEQDYRWRVELENNRLAVVIDNIDAQGCLFSAGVSLQRQPATATTMWQVLKRHGAQGIKISAAIYAHAWKLWRKGVKFQSHPERRKATDSES